MSTIGESLSPHTLEALGTIANDLYLGDPRDKGQCEAWIEQATADLARAETDLAWGRQHGTATTEGFWHWFAERYRRVNAARNRIAELDQWLSATYYSRDSPLWGAKRVNRGTGADRIRSHRARY